MRRLMRPLIQSAPGCSLGTPTRWPRLPYSSNGINFGGSDLPTGAIPGSTD